jgi:hypothetical protein
LTVGAQLARLLSLCRDSYMGEDVAVSAPGLLRVGP